MKKHRLNNPGGVSWQISLLLNAVLLIEFIYASAGINELLTAGIERVALGADFNGDVLLGAACLIDGAACAADNCGLIVGMDAFLHFLYTPVMGCLDLPQKGHSYKALCYNSTPDAGMQEKN